MDKELKRKKSRDWRFNKDEGKLTFFHKYKYITEEDAKEALLHVVRRSLAVYSYQKSRCTLSGSFANNLQSAIARRKYAI